MTSGDSQQPIRFGPFDVTTQVFLTTPHSFALVNLKPLLPGHVLVCPRAQHKRLTSLSGQELADLFNAVQRVQKVLAHHYFTPSPAQSTPSTPQTQDQHPPKQPTPPEAGSFNVVIQDGAEAGQTVPHLHVHVIPRIHGETAKDAETQGDAIYELIAEEAGNVGGALWDQLVRAGRPQPRGAFPRIEDQDRRPRTMEEMEAEALLYRRVLASIDGGGSP
ncbi:hit domain-containing protein [Xylaria intraflava]|nr:hit domain-containing protein [Xylaria intraflava]